MKIRPCRSVLAAGLAAAIVLLSAGYAPARAASVSFGTPTATSKFGVGVTFEQPVGGLSAFRRVEMLLDTPGALGSMAFGVAQPDTSKLEYKLDSSTGELTPNEHLTARWRITFQDGSQQLGPPVQVTYADDRFTWRSKSGAHVTFHWYKGDDAFAARALDFGEKAVEKAAAFFGVTETRPIDFFVYADEGAFHDVLGPAGSENVGGVAFAQIRTLFAEIDPTSIDDSWVKSVVPHELTHIVFHDATDNPYSNPAHWFNEGLAVYLSDGYSVDWRGPVTQAIGDKTIIPLEAIVGGFPRDGDRMRLAYGEAVSAIDFIVRKYGRPALIDLIKQYAKGLSDDEAFKAALGVDTRAFDQAWLAQYGLKLPEPYGPKAAPAGPLPPGWGSSTGSPAAGATAGTTAGASRTASGQTPASSNTTDRNAGERTAVLVALAAIAAALVLILIAALVAMRRSRAPKGAAAWGPYNAPGWGPPPGWTPGSGPSRGAGDRPAFGNGPVWGSPPPPPPTGPGWGAPPPPQAGAVWGAPPPVPTRPVWGPPPAPEQAPGPAAPPSGDTSGSGDPPPQSGGAG